MTYLYVLNDPRNPDEPRYVGKTCKPLNKRLSEHIADANRGVKARRCTWIRKLLREGVRPEIALIASVSGDGNEQEVTLIAQLRGICKLLNGTAGGEGGNGMNPESIARAVLSRRGFRHSAETKAKLSAARKGMPLHPNTIAAVSRKKSAAHIEKIAATKRGSKASDAVKIKLSAAQRAAYAEGRRVPPSGERFSALNKARTGIPLTEGHRKKVGAASRKVPRTEEWKANIAAAVKKHWETRKRT